MNSLFMNAVHCRNSERPPIWLMRQAGRYLPEYRQIRAHHRLHDLFHDPEKIVEITKLPIDLLGFDAAILFSDILTVLDGMGIRYDFAEATGPIIFDGIEKITIKQPEEAYTSIRLAIKELKRVLSVPLLGFAGAPFTIASYLLEGKTSREFKKTKQLLFQDPEKFDKLLNVIADATILYLKWQIESGVDAIQLFDSWANILGYWEFEHVALKATQKVLEGIKKYQIPIILFCRGSSFFVEEIATLNPHVISIDWSGNLGKIRKKINPNIALQGNLDPMILYGSKNLIQASVDRILASMEGDRGFIFNLGHGILPETPVENVRFLVDYLKNGY